MQDPANQGAPGEAPVGGAVGNPPPEGATVNVGAPVNQGAPGAGPEGVSAYDTGAEAGGQSPLDALPEDNLLEERPEILVGAAFVGGFALALIVKRLGQ